MCDVNDEVRLPEGVQRADLAAVAGADVVVLAVPYDAYPAVIPALSGAATTDTLVVDVCSVKVKPSETFAVHGLLERPNVLMTHPLFGPQSVTDGLSGKNMVVTQSEGEKSRTLLDGWQEKGVGIIPMTPEEHDQAMARIHVLPFFIGRSLLTMDIEESAIGTQYYNKLLALIDVERHHSAELFYTIQRHNPYAARMRAEFIMQLCLLHGEVNSGLGAIGATQPPAEQLSEYRDLLDVIDEARMILLGLRFGVTSNIGVLKAAHNLPSADPVREQQQRERLETQAAALGVQPDLALTLHTLITSEVVRQHEAYKHDL